MTVHVDERHGSRRVVLVLFIHSTMISSSVTRMNDSLVRREISSQRDAVFHITKIAVCKRSDSLDERMSIRSILQDDAGLA